MRNWLTILVGMAGVVLLASTTLAASPAADILEGRVRSLYHDLQLVSGAGSLRVEGTSLTYQRVRSSELPSLSDHAGSCTHLAIVECTTISSADWDRIAKFKNLKSLVIHCSGDVEPWNLLKLANGPLEVLVLGSDVVVNAQLLGVVLVLPRLTALTIHDRVPRGIEPSIVPGYPVPEKPIQEVRLGSADSYPCAFRLGIRHVESITLDVHTPHLVRLRDTLLPVEAKRPVQWRISVLDALDPKGAQVLADLAKMGSLDHLALYSGLCPDHATATVASIIATVSSERLRSLVLMALTIDERMLSKVLMCSSLQQLVMEDCQIDCGAMRAPPIHLTSLEYLSVARSRVLPNDVLLGMLSATQDTLVGLDISGRVVFSELADGISRCRHVQHLWISECTWLSECAEVLASIASRLQTLVCLDADLTFPDFHIEHKLTVRVLYASRATFRGTFPARAFVDLRVASIAKVSGVNDETLAQLVKAAEMLSVLLAGGDAANEKTFAALKSAESLKVLDLSSNPRLTAEHLVQFLEAGIRRLVVVKCRSVDADALTQLIEKYPDVQFVR